MYEHSDNVAVEANAHPLHALCCSGVAKVLFARGPPPELFTLNFPNLCSAAAAARASPNFFSCEAPPELLNPKPRTFEILSNVLPEVEKSFEINHQEAQAFRTKNLKDARKVPARY
eukprot:1116817-Rhodomonas_salina.1